MIYVLLPAVRAISCSLQGIDVLRLRRLDGSHYCLFQSLAAHREHAVSRRPKCDKYLIRNHIDEAQIGHGKWPF
jgi:hypothetical protein